MSLSCLGAKVLLGSFEASLFVLVGTRIDLGTAIDLSILQEATEEH